MKNKNRVLFPIVGMIFFGILFAGSLVLSFGIQGSPEASHLANEFLSDENITEVSVSQIITFLEYGLLYIALISLISAILGGISLYLLKKDNESSAASKLLIITAILSVILTLFLGIIGSIVYLIAGVKTILRNQKKEVLV